jgi:hypothetical protein
MVYITAEWLDRSSHSNIVSAHAMYGGFASI